MTTLFDDGVYVEYGQMSVTSDAPRGPVEFGEHFAGQANGILGAAVPGELAVVFGRHTGTVRLRVCLAVDQPASGDEWEEVVEVSFRSGPHEVTLYSWDGELQIRLPLTDIDYRVRYAAMGWQEGHDSEYSEIDGPVGTYQLWFWPAPSAPDTILEQTGPAAAYWHAAWAG